MERRIIPIIKSKLHPIPPIVVHYTSAEGFVGILESGKMRSTHILFMNDADELKAAVALLKATSIEAWSRGDQIDRRLLEIVLARIDALEKDDEQAPLLFIACFSTRDDHLGQWRAYGGECGLAIAFDTTVLIRTLIAKNALLFPCVYDDAAKREITQQVLREIRAIVQALPAPVPYEQVIDEALLLASYLAPMFKNRHFSEEAEWRAIGIAPDYARIVPRAKQSILSGYFDLPIFTDLMTVTHQPSGAVLKNIPRLPITHVTVGPSQHASLTKLAANTLLKRYDYKARAKLSAIPFRRGT